MHKKSFIGWNENAVRIWQKVCRHLLASGVTYQEEELRPRYHPHTYPQQSMRLIERFNHRSSPNGACFLSKFVHLLVGMKTNALFSRMSFLCHCHFEEAIIVTDWIRLFACIIFPKCAPSMRRRRGNFPLSLLSGSYQDDSTCGWRSLKHCAILM